MKLRWIFFVCVLSFTAGCGNSQKAKQKATPPETNQQTVKTSSETLPAALDIDIEEMANSNGFKPFYIYADKGSRLNHYVPSGFMPNGKCVTFNDVWRENCYSGETCVQIVYDVECSQLDQKWVGIYWLNPPNNWGRRKGGFNLTGANKLTFWAKGRSGNEQIQEFTVGGIEGDYPDTDKVVLGPIILTDQWKQYTIDLRGKDLSYISGGFAWATEADVNEGSCEFYLDNLRFE